MTDVPAVVIRTSGPAGVDDVSHLIIAGNTVRASSMTIDASTISSHRFPTHGSSSACDARVLCTSFWADA